MRQIVVIVGFLFIAFGTISCEKSEDQTPELYDFSPGFMMLYINEGNFRAGNASIGVYNFRTAKWLDDAFKSLNKRSLGDVCQSATLWNGNWNLVVNNSAKIEVVNSEKLKSVNAISGFTSPRHLLPVSTTKAYVSDLYANKIWIMTSSPMSITGSISVKGWTEEMILVNGKVWVVNKSRPLVYIIDPLSDQLDSMPLPAVPTSIAKSSGSKVWIGTDSTLTNWPKIHLINSTTRSIEQSFSPFFVRVPPDKFNVSATGDSLFYLSNGPCMIDGNTGVQTLINGIPGNWYGLGYDPIRRVVVYSDVKDFSQKSNIWMKFLDSGVENNNKGGIISSRFYFF